MNECMDVMIKSLDGDRLGSFFKMYFISYLDLIVAKIQTKK